MNKIELQRIEGVINYIFRKENGRTYYIHTNKGAILLNILNYSRLSTFISEIYGVNDNNIIGRKIVVYKDDFGTLAIESDQRDFCFIPDKISCDFSEIYFRKNIDYIKEKYNLTPEELLDNLKQESSLKLKRN